MYNFTFNVPTRINFGKGQISHLSELTESGSRVLLVYGGGSIKRAGIYDEAMKILKGVELEVFELSGVEPNPRIESVRRGVELCKANSIDMVLAIGGGSVIDCAKAIAAGTLYSGDVWDLIGDASRIKAALPVYVVLTMSATGSEMNRSGVTTNEQTREKLEMVGDEVRTIPEFALLDPTLTYTLPRYQMVSGCYDILCHCMEQYFSGDDDCVSDYLAEGVMRAIISATNAAVKDPMDYEARSNIMWCATWGLNGVIGIGKDQDWQLHDLGQSISAFTEATHGMTLSALTKAYYRHVLPAGMHRFARFATAVWGIPAEGRTDEELATAGLDALDAWLRGIGCVMNITELGVTEDMLEGIAAVTPLEESGYHPFTTEEFVEVLRESL